MIAANGPGFAGLYAGDMVQFRAPGGLSLRNGRAVREYSERTATVGFASIASIATVSSTSRKRSTLRTVASLSRLKSS